jgi:membrane protease YdiL (CAAX protease family)
LEIRRGWSYLLIVVISSFLFSFYHYLGNETFQLRSFAFRTLAGFYFGAVFAFRGFGITAGSHASYDVMVVLLRCVA